MMKLANLTTRLVLAALAVVMMPTALVLAECPAMPKPGPANAWLQQMVGQWTNENEATYMPGQPAEKSKGTETIRSVGGFWVMDEVKGQMMGKPFTGVMSLGYSPEKEKFIATWIDSMTGKLWEYEGTLDESGKILTLETDGECPMNPGKPMHFRETIELKGKNEKIFTSAIQGEDGSYMTTMVSRARRK